MQYSLLSRFQGVIAGVSLGSRLTRARLKSRSISINSQGLVNPRPQRLRDLKLYEANNTDKQLKLTRAESLVGQMTRSLTRCQGWDQTDWDRSWKQWQQDQSQENLGIEENSLIPDSNQESSESETTSQSLAEVALATLPLTLLFHEQPEHLTQHLQQGIEVTQESPLSLELEQAVLTFNLAIALALREELNPSTVLAKISNHLDPQTDFPQQLQEVQTLMEQNVSLETAQEQLLKSSGETVNTLKETTLVALALYSFVSRPHDPEIALLRTLQVGQPPTVCSLLGALSGAYNSFSSFPLCWQSQLKRSTSEELVQGEILTSATELFATWSGVYKTKNSFFEIDPTLAVAAPNVIRSSQS
ncbi:MAG: ADP-ribosylglycohydrolase family protein [Cyanobacteria bacterium J06592_8]